MDLKLALRQFGRAVDNNSPTILSGLAVAGVLGTVIMAIRATPKAVKAIDEEINYRMDEMRADDSDPELSVSETANICWQFYIPTMLMGATTITCIVMANHISTRRYAAVSSLLALAETAAREYEKKVEETIGEKKAQKIHDDVAQDHIDKHPIESSAVVLTGKGEHLFFDSFSARYFKSDVETIRRLVNDFNQRLLRCAPMFLPINDFYYEMGLESIEMGDEMGWNAEDNMLEVSTSSAKVVKGEPVIILEYKVWPKHY
jgi:hypothetical protein